MKKIAMMFAALSLCACTFTACGGDDDNNNESDSKAAKGESCAELACADGLTCNDSKVCEESSSEAKKAAKGESCAELECAEGLTCNDSKVCEESSSEAKKAAKGESCAELECDDGLYCGSDKKCAEMLKEGEACDDEKMCLYGLLCSSENVCSKAGLGDSCDLADCAEGLVCDENTNKCIEKPKGQAGDYCEKAEDCAEGLSCDGEEGGKTCQKVTSEGECFSDSDCTDPEKPICGEGYQCVAAPSDLCDGKCKDGSECVLGVCVTDAMKNLNEGDAYPADASSSFCNGDKLVYKGNDGNAHTADCSAGGYTGCVVFEMKGDVQADCNGQEAAIEACKNAQSSQEIEAWHTSTCLTSTELYKVYCSKDLSGTKDIAVPTYEEGTYKTAEECGTCTIEADGPVCSK